MTEDTLGLVVVILLLGTGITIAVLIAWFDHRTRSKALDVLRVYAERGDEPPESVTQALTLVSGWPKAPRPDDGKDRIGRSDHGNPGRACAFQRARRAFLFCYQARTTQRA